MEKSKEKRFESSYSKLKILKDKGNPFKRPDKSRLPKIPEKRVKVVKDDGRLSK